MKNAIKVNKILYSENAEFQTAAAKNCVNRGRQNDDLPMKSQLLLHQRSLNQVGSLDFDVHATEAASGGKAMMMLAFTLLPPLVTFLQTHFFCLHNSKTNFTSFSKQYFQ